jgi:predicted RNA-binding Zn ribbon-like protein
MGVSDLLVGGSLWLDLVNTIHMKDGCKTDLFDQKEAVSAWLLACKLLQYEQLCELEHEVKLTTLIENLRDLRNIFQSLLLEIKQDHEIKATSVTQLQSVVVPLRLKFNLIIENGCLTQHYVGVDLTSDILYQLIHSAITTLQQVSWDRLKQCQHEDCILHFVDTSKAGKRRWCSMETCGNRYKAAQFYAKRKRT